MKKVLMIIMVCFMMTSCNNNNSTIDNEESSENQDFSITKLDENDYLKFIENNDTLEEDLEIKTFIREDLNLDGKNQVVIGLGLKAIDGEEELAMKVIYVLNEWPELEIIGKIDNGYFNNELKLIKLKGSEIQYIYCGLTNYVNVYGFEIYKTTDTSIEEVCHDVSGTGAGFSELFDLDEDGYYDNYTAVRTGFDVLYYETDKSYLWQETTFVLDEHKVYIPKYPETIENVVFEFIALQAIQENSTEIYNRLTEIYPSEGDYNNKVIVFNDLVDYIIAVDETIIFEVSKKEDFTEVILTNGPDALSSAYTYTFKMIQVNGQWHIEEINMKD